METERETGRDGEWEREREKQVGKQDILFVRLPTKTIHQGFVENPFAHSTCAALKFNSKSSELQIKMICLFWRSDDLYLIFNWSKNGGTVSS